MIEPRSDKNDPALVELVDASLPFRAVSRAGDRLVAAWGSSAAARLRRTWLAVPLHRRVRLIAVAVIAAVATHLALTRLQAPEPTWWARAVWAGIVVLTAAVAVWSRSVAAAWTNWLTHAQSRDRVHV